MRSRTIAPIVVLTMLTCACRSDDSPPSATAPLPTSRAPATTIQPATTNTTSTSIAPTTTEPAATTTTASTEPATTAAASTTTPTTTDPAPPLLTEIPGTLVATAPGITTPGQVYELIPKVWMFIPTEPDPDNPRTQPPRPEDIPILEAYARSIASLYSMWVEIPNQAELTTEVVANNLSNLDYWRAQMADSAARGIHTEMRDGDVFNPLVVASPRSATEAFILDCQRRTNVDVYTATGELVDGEVEGLKVNGLSARLVRREGRWIVDTVAADERGCA